MKIAELITAYNATGRIAFYHPKKRTISINGGRCVPEKEGIKRIKECLNPSNSRGLK